MISKQVMKEISIFIIIFPWMKKDQIRAGTFVAAFICKEIIKKNSLNLLHRKKSMRHTKNRFSL